MVPDPSIVMPMPLAVDEVGICVRNMVTKQTREVGIDQHEGEAGVVAPIDCLVAPMTEAQAC